MGKLERQQKKLEAMQAKEELRLEKLREKELKKYQKQSNRKPLVNTPDISFRAESELAHSKDYEFKPKNTQSKKILAIILWIVIAFFTAKGIIAVINYEDSDEIKNKMDTYYETMAGKEDVRAEASTIAVNFLNEYYQYDANNNNWANRVQKYLANGVLLKEPTELESESCENIEVRDVTIDGDHIDVTLSVTIRYVVTGVTGDEERVTTKEGKIKYLVMVPVKTDGKNYAVLSDPVYVADYNKAQKIEPDEFEADLDDSLSTEQENILVKTAENFLTAYYGSKPSAL